MTCSRCAQCQSIRHPALLLMSTGNKSEEGQLYFAAWVTCRSRRWARVSLMCPRLSFTRWDSAPLYSPSHLFIMHIAFFLLLPLPRVHFIPFPNVSTAGAAQSGSVCLVYVLDKLHNTEAINHCHLAAQNVARTATDRATSTSSRAVFAQSHLDESPTLSRQV